jgi:hypothetical protein
MPRPSDVAPLKAEPELQEGVQGVCKWSCVHLISEENKLLLWTFSVYSRFRRNRVLARQQLDMNQARHYLSCLREECSWLGSNSGYPSLGLPIFYAMFKVLTTLTVPIAVFWTVTRFSSVKFLYFILSSVIPICLPNSFNNNNNNNNSVINCCVWLKFICFML